MNFSQKEAWEHIRLLSAGEKIPHCTPRVITMKMSWGQLVENDDDNVSVFASHFKNVLNNNKITDDSVINDIKQKEVTTEVDAP